MRLPLNEIVHGDCLEVLRTLPDESVSAVVCDPPYGLGQREPKPEDLLAYLNGAELKTGDFMNKPWDLPPVAVWKECFRVLKPGGYLLAFAGTRTQDLMSMGIRMAGFENRDTIAAQFGPSVLQWKYGSGFPKSHNVGAKIDKRLGLEREVIGTKRGVGGENLNDIVNGREIRQTTDDGGKGVGAYGVGAKQVAIDVPVTAPASEEAKKWEGWGNNLKPSWEPIFMFRKPVSEKTLVDQVLATGTGAINIDGCRIGGTDSVTTHSRGSNSAHPSHPTSKTVEETGRVTAQNTNLDTHSERSGRWPANTLFVHGSECRVVGSKKVKAPIINRFEDGMKPFGDGAGHGFTSTQTGDENGEEEIPLYECMEGCPVKALDNQSGTLKSGAGDKGNKSGSMGYGGGVAFKSKEYMADSGGASRFFAQFEPDAPFIYCAKASVAEKKIGKELEQHPTVKPVTLMQYLVRLVTPKGGVVLDPYSGSGTTCVAAVLEGVNFVGIEKHEPYVERGRIRVEMARRGEFSKSTKKTEPKKKKAKVAATETLKDAVEPEVSLIDLALNGDEQFSG
jgi:site-specific DNA-methyltransferase (adenine-specific)